MNKRVADAMREAFSRVGFDPANVEAVLTSDNMHQRAGIVAKADVTARRAVMEYLALVGSLAAVNDLRTGPTYVLVTEAIEAFTMIFDQVPVALHMVEMLGTEANPLAQDFKPTGDTKGVPDWALGLTPDAPEQPS
jgi:hypothetical protein